MEDLNARRDRWGISSYAIHEPYLDALAPVVERLAGRSPPPPVRYVVRLYGR